MQPHQKRKSGDEIKVELVFMMKNRFIKEDHTKLMEPSE